MIWALLAALSVLLIGGGDQFDLATPKDFRQTRKMIKEVISDESREQAVVDILGEIRDLEKASMKNLNKGLSELQGKKWGYEADIEGRQQGYEEVIEVSRGLRNEITDLLGEWKALMTEEEWNRYIRLKMENESSRK